MRIVLVNESFASPLFYRRWVLYANHYKDWEVFLLAPEVSYVYNSKDNTFGKTVTNLGEEVHQDNFHIKLFKLKYRRIGGGWESPDFLRLLCEIKPDVIYNIGTHTQRSLFQLIRIRKKYFPKTKLLSFSMRGPEQNASSFLCKDYPFFQRQKRRLYYLLAKYRISVFNKNCDAVLCHYPEALQCFRDEGYKGPIYICTQVGVNTERYYEDCDSRKEIRDKYQIGSSFLFGSATRFTTDKGLDDILDALPLEGNWKFLMMGSGRQDEVDRIKNHIRRRNLEGKVILPGLISRYEMPKYFNALDCLVHVPRTTPKWVETFSIAVVQAMATGKPIIGDSSGSVPYEIGPEGVIIAEGDIAELHSKMQWFLDNQNEALKIGTRMRERAVSCFGIYHLNDIFHDILHDVMNDQFDPQKVDMSIYKVSKASRNE